MVIGEFRVSIFLRGINFVGYKMKIAVMGTACIGKSTYIEDFLQNWKNYKLNDRSRYTEVVKEKQLKVNEEGDESSQMAILESLIKQTEGVKSRDNIIYDRCPLDNLVYTIWLNNNQKVSDDFVRETIRLVKKSLSEYDILFFLPISKQSPIVFEERDLRSDNMAFRNEIDFIFKALIREYNNNSTTYFPFDDKQGCPAIIEIYGDRGLRIELTKQYLDADGTAISSKSEELFSFENQLDVSKF